MNNSSYYAILLCLVAMLSNLNYAEIGCIEKSWHLEQSFDHKEYHQVEGGDHGPCHCPCSKYRAQARPLPYGQCPQCKHYRDVQSLIIVTKSVREAAAKPITSATSPVAYDGIDQLKEQWQKK